MGRFEPAKATWRFHLLLIEQVAWHAGHANIIREQLDGATAVELTFGIEGVKATTTSRRGSPRTPSGPASSGPLDEISLEHQEQQHHRDHVDQGKRHRRSDSPSQTDPADKAGRSAG